MRSEVQILSPRLSFPSEPPSKADNKGSLVVAAPKDVVSAGAICLTCRREVGPWYNGTGISCYVLGMLISAFALAAIRAG